MGLAFVRTNNTQRSSLLSYSIRAIDCAAFRTCRHQGWTSGSTVLLCYVDSLHEKCIPLHLGMLISLWLFLFPILLFAAQPKEFFLDSLKKLEQRSHKCVELRGEYVE
jgi:hypothetical protein